ncbi:hypothetical protein RYX36_016144 [Vicia faba]
MNGEKENRVKVVERVQTKSLRKVELVYPIPNPPDEEKVAEEEVKLEPEEEKKEEAPIVIVVLKVHMHYMRKYTNVVKETLDCKVSFTVGLF